ncbi:carbon-nitrogen family hydrolase [Paenibacillus assamensis]|uniref:carbon-nitrogen family hydrolase n=1 Tax=Paenibacillus assamensis TaxID=311244 RepID=UPI00040CAFC3|nr:carbon-nitrogen family hydrolase [Paenibacillus assamensis]
MNKTWNVCAIQMNIRIGEPERNVEEVIKQIEAAVAAHMPDVIVLPEMWNTGYALDRVHELADEDGKQTLKLLSEMASLHHVHIVGGSVAVKEEGQIRNRSYVVNKKGELVHSYDKAHLFKLMDEHVHLHSGNELGIFELDGVKCGIIICYDLRFPEYIRSLALQHIEVLFVPAQWPNPRLHHWKTLLTARAIENQMYVVACNRMGTSIGSDGKPTSFFGHSMIIDPWGELIVEGDDQERLIQGELTISLVQEVRSRIPVFEDRRDGLYQLQK